MPKKIVSAALESRVNTIVERHAAKAAVARHGRSNEAKPGFHFVNKDEEADLYLYDEVSSWWGVSANDFISDLREIDAKTINLHINSPGGSVFEGYAIYSALVRHSEKTGAKIRVEIDSLAASIASVIACAGDEIRIGAHAQIMIHQPFGWCIGTGDEMREEAEVLDSIEATICDIYEARTGQDRKQIEDWVRATKWFKGEEAVSAGFADSIAPLKTKKSDDDGEEDRITPSAAADSSYFAAILPGMPAEVREMFASAANAAAKSLPKTEREFKNFLREHGYSGKQADAIAGHGFRPKTEPRDEAVESEKPTTPERRDDAEERDEAVAAIRAATNAAAIRAAAFNLTR